MGVTICPEHGEHSGASVCHHVARRVEQKENATGSVLKVDISETDVQWSHYFCLECLERFALPVSQETVPESVLDDFQEAFDLTVLVCGECFRTYYSEARAE